MQGFTVCGETKSLWVCGWSHLLSAGKLGGSPTKTSCSLCSWIPNTIQGSTQCVSPHLYDRFRAGFYVITLKLIQNKQTNKKRGAVFYDVTPCCTETTLGVSKSNSLLGSKEWEGVCRSVKPHPRIHAFAHIYVISSIHINIGVKYVFQLFSLYQTQQRNSPHPCRKTWCGVNDKLVNVSICCTASATAALCNRQAQTWLLWMERREGRSWLVSFF